MGESMNLKYLLSSIFLGVILLVGCSNNGDSNKDANEESKIEENESEHVNNEETDDKEDESTDDQENNKDTENKTDDSTNEDDLNNDKEETEHHDNNIDEDYTFNVTEDGNQVIVEVGAITFIYPNTFSETIAESQLIPTFEIANADQTIIINAAVEQLPMKMTPEEYISIASSNYGIEYEEVSMKTNANGIEFTEAITEQTGIKVNQRIIIVDNTAYIFSYASASYEENLNIYDQIIDSIDIN